jgi:hypothetical protein
MTIDQWAMRICKREKSSIVFHSEEKYGTPKMASLFGEEEGGP